MDRARQNIERRTGAHDPHVVVADVDLAARVVVLEELPGGDDRDGVLFIVDAGGGEVLGIDVVRECLVPDLPRYQHTTR